MLTSLRLQNFRSYKDDSFEFEPNVNIVVGPNASGKTNLLEGVLVMAQGRSYRVGDLQLIKKGQKWTRLDANLSDGGNRTMKIQTTNTKPTKSFEINDKKYSRINLDQSLPAVLFEPNDLRLLSDEPSSRREYLDNFLSQIEKDFSRAKNAYKRTLSQRNGLLKGDPTYARKNLFAWDVRLSELGGRLAGSRHNLIKNINKQLGDTYSRLAGTKTKITASYESTLKIEDYANALLKQLERTAELDIERGFTGSGPHRDDLIINIEGSPAAVVASRGEVRTILLALKTLELELIESLRGQKPLLLLDDVFSELDGKRRKALTRFLRSYQTFITTTDADVVVQDFMNNCHVITTTKA